MPIILKEVLSWGRSLQEYIEMFNLKNEELGLKLLSCADGASSFNMEARKLGFNLVSCDPIYSDKPSLIKEKLDVNSSVIFNGIRRNKNDYNWSLFKVMLNKLAGSSNQMLISYAEKIKTVDETALYFWARQVRKLSAGNKSGILYSSLEIETLYISGENTFLSQDKKFVERNELGSVDNLHITY